jgi:hypothetical protein
MAVMALTRATGPDGYEIAGALAAPAYLLTGVFAAVAAHGPAAPAEA